MPMLCNAADKTIHRSYLLHMTVLQQATHRGNHVQTVETMAAECNDSVTVMALIVHRGQMPMRKFGMVFRLGHPHTYRSKHLCSRQIVFVLKEHRHHVTKRKSCKPSQVTVQVTVCMYTCVSRISLHLAQTVVGKSTSSN